MMSVSICQGIKLYVVRPLRFLFRILKKFCSSGTYNGSGSRFSIDTFSGVLSVNQWEFCYTNAELQGGTLLPDINDLGGNANVNFQAVGLLVACVFCLLIGFRIFR